jgi:predicted ArsR family transcriptional regulator
MGGRPKRVSDAEILREIKLASGPVATAPELSDRLHMQNSGVNKRLDDLVAAGLVRQREVGASAVVYWLSEDGEAELADAEF